jgi:hypothetical protein
MPSRRRLLSLTVAAALATAAAAHAGTAYVPLPGITTVGSATWDAEVSIANPAAQGLTASGLLLPNDSDGTQRGAASSYTVAAGQTMVLHPGASFVGLAELAGSPNARYSARLVGQGAIGKLGVALPVITSASSTPGGGALTLAGLAGSATRATSVAVVNLGKAASTCSLSFVGANGAAVGSPQSLAMKPLSQRIASNVFAGLGDLTTVRASVSCSRDFYAFAMIGDTATGEIAVVVPAGSGESTLTRPGEEAACPTGASCYTSSVVFKPTSSNPVGHVVFPSPNGTYRHLRLSLDVTIGDWFASDPDGKHLVYWWVINRNLDMPGMLYFRGNDAYTALSRWGIGLKHEQKKKATVPFQGIPGHTYRVVNDVDFGLGSYVITITDLANNQVTTITDTPNVAQVVLHTTDKFLIDMGFKEGAVFDEVPSYGWTYTNFRLDVIP